MEREQRSIAKRLSKEMPSLSSSSEFATAKEKALPRMLPRQ